jgi:hypothetical protein
VTQFMTDGLRMVKVYTVFRTALGTEHREALEWSTAPSLGLMTRRHIRMPFKNILGLSDLIEFWIQNTISTKCNLF